MIREPVVAGQFYPASAKQVAAELDQLIRPTPAPQDAIAVVVPHAGWMYSGTTAGVVYSKVRIPDRVVMVGPNHHGVGSPYAIFEAGVWRTPLGDVPVDEPVAAKLAGHCELLTQDTG